MFLFVCILVMWLMIFGVALLYVSSLKPELSSPIMYRFQLIILVSSLVWILFAFGLTFKGTLWSPFFSHPVNLNSILELLFQLCFCLYAIVMLIGSVIDRMPTSLLLKVTILWMLLVYCPLAFLIWNPHGFLASIGVRDFSGGMVVHLSAGLSSLILAKQVGKTPHQHPQEIQVKWQFLGVLLVTFGWFGFNAGPAGDFNQLAAIALLNSFLAIISGGISFSIAEYVLERKHTLPVLLNGTVVGLVTSTAGVGFVSPLQMVFICFFASFGTYALSFFIAKYLDVDDVVDSFAMNGIGGFLGSLGVICFDPSVILAQLLSLIITILLSVVGTYLIVKLCHSSNKL
ncbi:ammonium transporter [Streptococcus pseudoporcinus]|uniref:Ammonium transporter n=1 Tax=Streptococcus pseudoporcinus TaxID=361101 RepID=A0A4U9XXF9_9STRE|nr:ammonium transporter [Streptococcus pseudoporcinus]VTS17962.1 ammonium transporter [Streptococcus pseudoporcinus]